MMKKILLVTLAAVLISCAVTVSVSAIDTPWVTISPDGGTTEGATSQEPPTEPPTQQPADPETDGTEGSDTPDSTASSEPQTGGSTPQSSESEEVSSAPQPQQTEAFQTKESLAAEPSKGCSSVASGFGWLAMIGGVWMLCRTKHGEKKEVNE